MALLLQSHQQQQHQLSISILLLIPLLFCPSTTILTSVDAFELTFGLISPRLLVITPAIVTSTKLRSNRSSSSTIQSTPEASDVYNPHSSFSYNSSYSNNNNHNHNNNNKEFQKNQILYQKRIFSPVEYQLIKDEISSIPKSTFQNEKSNSVARNRVGVTLDNDCEIVRLLACETGSMYNFVNDIATSNDDKRKSSSSSSSSSQPPSTCSRFVLSKAVPIEVSYTSFSFVIFYFSV